MSSVNVSRWSKYVSDLHASGVQLRITFRLHKQLPFVDMENETESVTAALEDNR